MKCWDLLVKEGYGRLAGAESLMFEFPHSMIVDFVDELTQT